MDRQPLPDDAVIFERDGREFVRFPENMFVYEYDETGSLARVPFDELPPLTAPLIPNPNPSLEALRQEILAAMAAGEI